MTTIERHRGAVRDRLLGSDHERAGPGSVTWTVNRQVIVVAGWGRAILMQLAHPAVAAGVHHHSSFRGSLRASLKRLQSTVSAMQAITFGDTDAMIDAAARINAIHDRVRGHSADGVSYSAHNTELQQWVHATLLESIPLAYERLVGALPIQEWDQYCVESAIMEPLLGMPVNSLPRSARQLDNYMRGMLGGDQLSVTDTSRALARAVLYPPNWRVAWPAFRAMQLLTIGSLPLTLREAYGFRWEARDTRALARWTTVLRAWQRTVPVCAREWPTARRDHRGVNAARSRA